MLFYGHSTDTFKDAVGMLIEETLEFGDIDCISGRTFYLDYEHADTLYSCVLPLEEAVKNLREIMNCPVGITDIGMADGEFVLEIKNSLDTPYIVRKYYPFEHYVLCRREKNKVYINDPDGFPLLSYPVSVLPTSHPVIIRTGNSRDMRVDIDIMIKRIRKRVFEHSSACPDREPDRIFLRYAVSNYVCQINKIAECLCRYANVPENILSRMKQILSQLVFPLPVSTYKIYQADKEIYCLLEEILCSQTCIQ